MNEAKYSANVKANLRGYDVQITARSDGEDDLLTVLVSMVEELDRIGALPERRWENGKTNGNGNGHVEPKAEVKPQPAQAQPAQAAVAAKAAPKQATRAAAPVLPACQQCGSNASVELIKWADKVTGEMKQAYKCQACTVWLRE